MKKELILSFFLLGLTSIIAQVIILRELTVSFYGNEFFIGIILAAWLFWVAIASKISEKILNKLKNIFLLLLTLHFLIGIFLFLQIFLIRYLKTFIGFSGEIPNLALSFFSSLLIPAPLCLILGIWWTIGTRIFSKEIKVSNGVNKAYFWETIGFVLGGILFSFFLFLFQEFLIAAILLLINAFIIFILILQKQKNLIRIISAFLILFFIFLIFSPYLETLNKITNAFRFKNQTLIESTNSPYGNIAVTKTEGQYNFYESGLLLGSTALTQFPENLIHLSLLEHPSPEKILLIGGGFTGALNEILKHPVQKIYYLELDSKLIEISQKYISQEFKAGLNNPKVKIITTDGRYFLKKTKEKFDVILINLPDPSTILLNRFYTQEFFQQAKEKLNKNGIFATYLTFSSSSPGKNLEDLNASLYKTLKKVFSEVLILPEETNLFLASENQDLIQDPEISIQRFRERKIETKFLTESYITYRLSNDRIEKTLNLFEKNKNVRENKDLKPISYFYQTLFWLDHFDLNFSKFFKNLAASFWWIFGLILVIFVFFLIKKKKKLLKLSPIFSVAIAGFSLMALEMLIIFSYQTIIGYLYFKIALLIACLMAGLALGVWYGNKKNHQWQSENNRKIYKELIKFHLLFIIFSCLLFPLLLILSRISLFNITEVIFLVSIIAAGFLGGAIFPISNNLYLSFQPEPNKKTGTIYSANLFGSCFGAILPSLILIPIFGVFQTLIFIVIVNFLVVLILFFFKNLSGESI